MSRAWVVPLLFLASGCVSAPEALSAPFVNVVLWKLKPGAGDRAVELVLDDAKALLQPIPQVKGLWIGRPVPLPAGQDFTLDGDYDIGLLVVFESQREYEAFRSHPSFIEFERRNSPKIQTRLIAFSPYSGPPRY